jgi:hypothetical protein
MFLTFLPNLSLAATSAITFALVALVLINGTRRKQSKRQRRLDRNERLQSI